jgi:hypothetical protein
VENGHEIVEPELSRAEWALSIVCGVLTLVTLLTFLVAARNGHGPTGVTKHERAAESARPSPVGRSSDGPVIGTVTPPAAVPPARSVRPLSDLLVDVAPAGYRQLSADVGPSGPFDLDTFVRASRHPADDRVVLSQNGFRQGFARSWAKAGPDGTSTFIVSVFQFDDVRGARALVDHESVRSIRDDGAVAMPVPVGAGLKLVHRDGDQTLHGYAVSIPRDDGLLFYVAAFYPSPQAPDEVLDVARRQLERLEPETVSLPAALARS